MDESREESQFIVDDVSKTIKEAIETTIGGNAYQHDKVNNWTGQVVENCLTVLTKEQKPYKYIVTAMIMQKNGAGLHTASSCYWNNDTDGSCTVRWENKTMYCIVSVFGLAGEGLTRLPCICFAFHTQPSRVLILFYYQDKRSNVEF
ncbi:hypothetical protein ACLKA7_009508 [Drosophila subpalustris]